MAGSQSGRLVNFPVCDFLGVVNSDGLANGVELNVDRRELFFQRLGDQELCLQLENDVERDVEGNLLAAVLTLRNETLQVRDVVAIGFQSFVNGTFELGHVEFLNGIKWFVDVEEQLCDRADKNFVDRDVLVGGDITLNITRCHGGVHGLFRANGFDSDHHFVFSHVGEEFVALLFDFGRSFLLKELGALGLEPVKEATEVDALCVFACDFLNRQDEIASHLLESRDAFNGEDVDVVVDDVWEALLECLCFS